MKQNNVRDLTLTSVFAAIIIVMTFVPYVGFIGIGTLSLTLIHIPVLIGVFLLPKKYSISLGFIFGIASMLKAMIAPETPLDPLFANPLISVLPRVLFAASAAYLFDGIKYLQNKFKHNQMIIFALVSSITTFGIYYAFKAISEAVGWNFIYVIPFVLAFIALMISAYFGLLQKHENESVLYPSTFMLSTFIHSILVLSALGIFGSTYLKETLLIDDVIGAILFTLMSNGFLEALLAAFIGTPIMIALNNVKNQ
jgi:uncharacterized membrane protein